jgi:RNA polymerase sigma-70 factor (ECF subfamily)
MRVIVCGKKGHANAAAIRLGAMTLLSEKRELLKGFRAGERRALEEVYRHYAPVIAAFLQAGFGFQSGERMLRFAGYRQPFDLDNALQETFLRAFREPARLAYDGLRPYRSYLYMIARNVVIDDFRRAGSSPVFADAPAGSQDALEPGADPAELAPTPEDDAMRREIARLYASFSERLEERERSFFRMRFGEGRTQAEIGEAAGLSAMQVRTLEKKLRTAFVVFLNQHGYLDGTSAGGSHVL